MCHRGAKEPTYMIFIWLIELDYFLYVLISDCLARLTCTANYSAVSQQFLKLLQRNQTLFQRWLYHTSTVN